MPRYMSRKEEIVSYNNEIQEWISNSGQDVPEGLLHLLSNLDWYIKNWIDDTERVIPNKSDEV